MLDSAEMFSRFLHAIYMRTDATVKVTNSYNETISYDQNSNITSILRNGNNDNQTLPTLIDNLSYQYKPINNQLLWVKDLSNSTSGFKNGTNPNVNPTTDLDYDFDNNGNQRLDNNKKITGIKYNHLNLPTEILFLDTNTKITYLYNAAGIKIRKTAKISANATITTDYLGGFQYKTTATGVLSLQFFPTSEGYVNNTVVSGVNKYNYVYNYLDQLGNVRLSYTKNPDPTVNVLTILEENHYYPYGLKHSNYNANQFYLAPSTGGVIIKVNPPPVGGLSLNINNYKYNGKEYQDELALNLYDMDMRDYDPEIARWTGIDPVTHFSQSPYNAFDGNPIINSDPSGADSIIYGMAGQTANANQWNQGHSSFGNAGYSSNYSDPLRKGSGSGWGDGGLLSISLDWNALDLYTNLSFSSTGINVTSSNDIAEVLSTVTVYAHKGGRWKDSAGSIIRQHVYANGANYASYREAQTVANIYSVATSMQDVGDGAMVIGTASVLTGYGAVVGAGMIEYGGHLSMAGTASELYGDYRSGTLTREKIFTKIAMEAIPYGSKIPFQKLGTPQAAELVNAFIIGFDRMLDEFRDAKVGPYR